MDKFSWALLTAPKENRFKHDKYYLNRLTGEFKVVIHPVQIPKGKFWISISRKCYDAINKE
jgi:hypothetical protein